MNLKDFFIYRIRGWIPEEPQIPRNLLKNLKLLSASHLRFSKSLLLLYFITLGFVASSFIVTYLEYSWNQWSGSNYFSYFLRNLPQLFWFNIIPLVIFTVVFFTKGGGFNSLRGWNQGKKSYLALLAIAVGYIFVIITPRGEYLDIPSHVDFYYTYFGLSLITIGFVSLALLYKKTNSSREESISEKPKGKKKKILLVLFACLLIIILAGFHIQTHIRNEKIYEQWQYSLQPMPHIINEQWTDNVGVESNYVNYKGIVFNSGNTLYNVTLLVNLHLTGKPIETANFFLGDLGQFRYEVVDVNIEYSGKLIDVFSGINGDSEYLDEQ